MEHYPYYEHFTDFIKDIKITKALEAHFLSSFRVPGYPQWEMVVVDYLTAPAGSILLVRREERVM